MLLTIAEHLDSRVRDGRVVENRIFFDRAEFERKLGISLQ